MNIKTDRNNRELNWNKLKFDTRNQEIKNNIYLLFTSHTTWHWYTSEFCDVKNPHKSHGNYRSINSIKISYFDGSC